MRLPSTRMLVIAVLVAGAVAAVAALATASGGDDDALVVYNGRSHYGGEAAFKRFEQETGIKVKLFGGDATELFERLRNEGEGTPADVLVTVDGANLWQAKEAGLLAPVRDPALARAIPADLRDRDDEFFAISTRVRTIVRSTDRVGENDLASYADLGDPRWKGRICLRTSNNIYNQSLVADLLAKRGARATEQLLRSWMANEPRILGSDVDVLEAIAGNQCDVSLVNHYYLGRMLKDDPRFPVAPVWVDQDAGGVHANISGAGVVATSDRPAQAARLIAYLAQPAQQRDIASKSEFPANPDVEPPEHIRSWTGFETDPIDVSAAGRQQRAAVQLMAKVGWQ